jgi:hypothetical protein
VIVTRRGLSELSIACWGEHGNTDVRTREVALTK